MLSLTKKALEEFDNQHDFERMCADILNSLGYTDVVLIAPRGGGDGGCDITFSIQGGGRGLACVTLRKDSDNKFHSDFSKRRCNEYQKYYFFTNRYLTADQKKTYRAYCSNVLDAELITKDIEALRSLLDSSLPSVRERYLHLSDINTGIDPFRVWQRFKQLPGGSRQRIQLEIEQLYKDRSISSDEKEALDFLADNFYTLLETDTINLHTLPIFPYFKKVELKDRHVIEQFTTLFDPYSDFDFLSIWIYSAMQNVKISNIQGNLAMIQYDYLTQEPFYTFLGRNNVSSTIQTLLHHAKEKHLRQELRLIPRANIINDTTIFEKFLVIEDRDNADYIYSTAELSDLSGSKHADKRKKIEKFLARYPDHSIDYDLSFQAAGKHILNLLNTWRKRRGLSLTETSLERTAIQALLEMNEPNLLSIGIYHQGNLLAYSINKVINNRYATVLFNKADNSYQGIFEYLWCVNAKNLCKRSIEYINGEQDLGIAGLRRSKQSHVPVFFLKKFIIRENRLNR